VAFRAANLVQLRIGTVTALFAISFFSVVCCAPNGSAFFKNIDKGSKSHVQDFEPNTTPSGFRLENACAAPELVTEPKVVEIGTEVTVYVRGLVSVCADHWTGPVHGELEPVGGIPVAGEAEVIWQQEETSLVLGVVELDTRGDGVLCFRVPPNASFGPAEISIGELKAKLDVS
jgi:hypothetical protein